MRMTIVLLALAALTGAAILGLIGLSNSDEQALPSQTINEPQIGLVDSREVGKSEFLEDHNQQDSANSSNRNLREQTIDIDIQNLAGISLGRFSSLIEKYEDLESQALRSPGASFDAAMIREKCDYFGSIGIPNENQVPEGLITLSEECRHIAEISQLETWELISLAAESGIPDAILKLPSYPPEFHTSDTDQLASKYHNWQDSVLHSIQSLADSGNRAAMLKAAQLLSGEFSSFKNYDQAIYYLELYLSRPSASEYENALATRLWRQLNDRSSNLR